MAYLESGNMNDESTRGVLPVLHGVYDDKVTKTMMEERQSCSKARWTCPYNENGGAVRK